MVEKARRDWALVYGYVHGSLINCRSGFNSPVPYQRETP